MNKTALKNFAVGARNELIERVELQALKIGISKEKIEEADVESSDAFVIQGNTLTDLERRQRNQLIARIEDKGYDQVIEEVSYTWFNRFVALRFMEVNDYLPTRVRVLSSESDTSREPEMIKEALTLDLDIDKEKVYNLKMNNETDELFKYLIQLHCNDLNKYMPFMFETLEDYKMILFPEGLLGTESFVMKMIDKENIPEQDWQQVEIIGWLYQYYIAEEKDEIFKNFKKNIKITQDTLPAATQIFTPNWIVKYMVENSLGRLWIESYPESSIKDNWEYYLDVADQNEETLNQLEAIRYKNVNPEEITFLDPACGSGHILVYAFDVFYDMYEEKGYMASEIPKLILENNLYGIDIDDRAAQLASFSVLMKAREKSKRILRQEPDLNIISIQDSKWLTEDVIKSLSNNDEEVTELYNLKNKFDNAKEFGSIIDPSDISSEKLNEILKLYYQQETDLLNIYEREKIERELPRLIEQINALSNNYDVVCTNPPYMGRRSMNLSLRKYLDKYYPITKADLFSVFIERGFELTKSNGFNTAVTMQSWMFLSTFKKMRNNIFDNHTIHSLLHMDNNVMGIAFGTSATIFRNYKIKDYQGSFTEVKNRDLNSNNIPNCFPVNKNRQGKKSEKEFKKIPGNPIAYWPSSSEIDFIFSNSTYFEEIVHSFQGIITGSNKKYLRFWYETKFDDISINSSKIEEVESSNSKWIPYNKGGGYRKWYGNNLYILYWTNKGRHLTRSRSNNSEYYLKKGVTWSFLTSSEFSARYFEEGYLWDVAGSSLFLEDTTYDLNEMLSFMNSKVSKYILAIYNPTLNFQVENIIKLPYIQSANYLGLIINKTNQNIELSKKDWDSFEISWEFEKHPLLNHPSNTIVSSFNSWQEFSEDQFNQLKANEEELNRIFIEIYGLKEELTSEVEDKDVTVNKADIERDIKSFISYAVGCALGRYSLDEDGLIYTGGELDSSRYQTFPADENNILPILPNAYFEDDIVSLFIKFVETVYGSETLEENLTFVAEAIGKRVNESSREGIRRYFLNDFYKDHVQTYKKHPIYWQISSGEEKAFNCLIYMHRYDKTTLSRIRTDYLHEVQARYDTVKSDLQYVIDSDASTSEIRDAKKELTSIDKKITELKTFDEKLHHMADMQIEIDLDDGVKENYKKFKGLVTKI